MNQADGDGFGVPEAAVTDPVLLPGFIRASQVLQAGMDEELKTVGLSWPKFDVLVRLLESRLPLLLSELADVRRCVPSNMTTLIERLEAEALVVRVTDPSDRRSRRVHLTVAGAARAREGMEIVNRLDEQLGDGLPEDEKRLLLRILAELGALT